MGLKVCENQEFLLVQIATQLSIISDYSDHFFSHARGCGYTEAWAGIQTKHV